MNQVAVGLGRFHGLWFDLARPRPCGNYKGSRAVVERNGVPRACLLVLVLVFVSWADVHPPTRCRRDAGGQLVSLDTAITHFKHPRWGYTVDLVSALHVGPKGYYRSLNKVFPQYDAVLYELVADASEGRPIPVAGLENRDPLSQLHRGLGSTLGLELQFNHLDYSPANFVQADISPREFRRSVARRQESFVPFLVRGLQSGGLESPEAERELEQVGLWGLMGKGPTARDQVHLRRCMALIFAKPERMAELLEGPGGTTLISVRNQKALKVLYRELYRGKKRVAIFYGAAHMPDLEKRLVSKFHLECTGQSWVPAWDLR